MSNQLTYEYIIEKLKKCISAFSFIYNGKNCGFEPYYDNNDKIKYCDVWCGNEVQTIAGIDNAFDLNIFDGKKLKDIFDDIDIMEY